MGNLDRGRAQVKSSEIERTCRRVTRPPGATALRLLILLQSFFARRKEKLHFVGFRKCRRCIDSR
jgi:hypothetical protein